MRCSIFTCITMLVASTSFNVVVLPAFSACLLLFLVVFLHAYPHIFASLRLVCAPGHPLLMPVGQWWYRPPFPPSSSAAFISVILTSTLIIGRNRCHDPGHHQQLSLSSFITAYRCDKLGSTWFSSLVSTSVPEAEGEDVSALSWCCKGCKELELEKALNLEGTSSLKSTPASSARRALGRTRV